MSRLPSAETMLKSERRINKALRTQLADAIRSSGEYRHRATKAEQEAADWKRRFDALLAREPIPGARGS